MPASGCLLSFLAASEGEGKGKKGTQINLYFFFLFLAGGFEILQLAQAHVQPLKKKNANGGAS